LSLPCIARRVVEWHTLAHFSSFNLRRFTSIYFGANCEIASVYAGLGSIFKETLYLIQRQHPAFAVRFYFSPNSHRQQLEILA
jgi:hypothetical protein